MTLRFRSTPSPSSILPPLSCLFTPPTTTPRSVSLHTSVLPLIEFSPQVNDELRARFRHLDLRRTALANNIRQRSHVSRLVRESLHADGACSHLHLELNSARPAVQAFSKSRLLSYSDLPPRAPESSSCQLGSADLPPKIAPTIPPCFTRSHSHPNNRNNFSSALVRLIGISNSPSVSVMRTAARTDNPNLHKSISKWPTFHGVHRPVPTTMVGE